TVSMGTVSDSAASATDANHPRVRPRVNATIEALVANLFGKKGETLKERNFAPMMIAPASSGDFAHLVKPTGANASRDRPKSLGG
ncbi:MAG: hypothetical protein KDB16_04055, partial [Acidimicrobiales bacterium]|nr:hypothetical protein [Acidimicrobiales bacterium]